MTQPKRLLVGIVLGTALGILTNVWSGQQAWLNALVLYVAEPAGKIFLRLLLMLVVPLAFSALTLGISELQPSQLGRLGLRTLTYTVLVSLVAVLIGLALVNLMTPGASVPEALRESVAVSGTQVASKRLSAVELVVAIVPSNPIAAAASGDMLAFIVFALAFGLGLAGLRTRGAAALRLTLEGVLDVSMRLIELVLKLAPIGVGALLFSMAARVGVSVVAHLGRYVLVVVLGLGLHLFVVYSLLLKWQAKVSPIWFFRRIRLVLTTAFSTASSNATLPTALRVAETELGLPRDVSRFVLTAGASMNQNGTALFEGVTVLFLAQAYGVELSIVQQLTILVIAVLAGIGTAGVPAGSLPVIAAILGNIGVPPEAVGLILGVDRLLDMCRTTVNVAGDLVLATIVASSSSGSTDPRDATDNPSRPPSDEPACSAATTGTTRSPLPHK